MTEAEFLSRYEYLADTVNSWRVLNSTTGPLRGDCDDYAVTMLYITEGNNKNKFWEALRRDRARIYIVTGYGGGKHAALWYRGKGWTDSQNRFWGPRIHTIRFKASISKIQYHVFLEKNTVLR